MQTNRKTSSSRPLTHEGGVAKRITPLQELRRTLLACLLFENTFYESGNKTAARIEEFAAKVKPEELAALCVEARTKYKLRHAPLFLARQLARHATGAIVSRTIYDTIRRADELAEFVALYWRDGRKPLSAQVKKGLAKAFTKFDAYQLAKYNRADRDIKLRDVLFLVHAKPKDAVQADLWKRLIDDKLSIPESTWEGRMLRGADKKSTFTDLLKEKKLGYMALLRNLRNMQEAGVDKRLVHTRLIEGAANSKALPFRFIAAANACPRWEDMLDNAMVAACEGFEKLPGTTVLLIDVSYSMVGTPISKRSELDRLDAAAALAIMAREMCDEDIRIYAFSNHFTQVRPRRGMALRDKLRSQPHGGTPLAQAIERVQKEPHDRLIVFTDEQMSNYRLGRSVPNPVAEYAYMVNVASYENGVGYGRWTHIDGFSEAILEFIVEYEKTTD